MSTSATLTPPEVSASPHRNFKSPVDHLTRMRKLYELSMTLSGDPIDIFRHIAHMIGDLLNVKVVCLSEVKGDELIFLSVYVQGKMYSNAGQCDLSITPCSTVESSKDYRVYDRVAERFPEASFLKDHNAYSYCGFPALDNLGNVVAVTCLLDDEPHDFTEEDHEILRIFGQRIGMEMERQHHLEKQQAAEEELRKHHEHLEDLVVERTQQLEAAQSELVRKERLATLGQLIATVSHELRNPLGTIRSSVYTVNEKLAGKELGVDKALQRIQRNIDRSNNIITELLDFTRIKEPTFSMQNLDTWVKETIDDFEKPNNIDVTLSLNCDVDVSFDKSLLQRALLNIYDNGCQAIEGEGTMLISTNITPINFIIKFEDSGCGIDEDTMAHIFEPLFSTKGFGVGLGLPISKQIVDQHRGDIEFKSSVGKGTCVAITIPSPMIKVH